MSPGSRSTVQDRMRELDARVVAGDRGASGTSGEEQRTLAEQLGEAILLIEEVSRRAAGGSSDTLTDACRQGLAQLDEARHRLESPDHDPAHAGVHADLVRADLRRALSLVRTALGSGAVGARSADDEALQVAVSLRRRYARLRQALRRGDTEAAESRLAALRAAQTSIAEMREDPAFAHVRVADRLQLANIQQRVASWLAGPADDEEGARLHRLLALLANELLHINQRSSLRGHDASALQRAAAHLASGSPGAPPSSPVLEALGLLEGRDEQVDALLAALREGRSIEADHVRGVLAGAASSLGVGTR